MNLNQTINYSAVYTQYTPQTPGLGQEPAASCASIVRASLCSPPNCWSWNRNTYTFTLTPGIQDYLIPFTNVPDLGFAEIFTLVDPDNSKIFQIKDVYNNVALSKSQKEQRPNSVAIQELGNVSSTVTHTLTAASVMSNVASLVFDSVAGFMVGQPLTLTVMSGATFLNGQTVTIASINVGTNTVTANFTHADYPGAGTDSLVATLSTAVANPFATYDPVLGKAIMFDLSSGAVNRIDCNSSTPAVDSTYSISGGDLSNFNVLMGSIAYIGNTVYIGYNDPITGHTQVRGLSDTAYTLLDTITVDNSGLQFPNTMRAWSFGGTNYLGMISGDTTAQTLRVYNVSGYANTLVFSDTAVCRNLANRQISGQGPYFFPDPNGNIWVIYAYNTSGTQYTVGGAGHVAPQRWNLIKYTSVGAKTTYDFAADADGNCGTGGFYDPTTNMIVVSCNQGAYKIFDPVSTTVTTTYGSAASPTYVAAQEYNGHTNSSEAIGLLFTGTQGFPEVQQGSTFAYNGEYFYGINTADSNINSKIDVRKSSDLTVLRTVDISLLIAGYIPSGINQYPGWIYIPSKNWLFVTDSSNSTHTYVLFLATQAGSNVATGSGLSNESVTGFLIRFVGVPDKSYTSIMTYQKTPQSFGPFVITAAANASGGTTAYTGIFDPLSFPLGSIANITGFVTNAVNNGSFFVANCTTTTLTLSNAAGVAETVSAFATNFDWAPVPDWYNDAFQNLYLSEMLTVAQDFAKAQMYRQRGVAAFLSKATGLTEAQKNMFAQQWLARTNESSTTNIMIQTGVQSKGV